MIRFSFWLFSISVLLLSFSTNASDRRFGDTSLKKVNPVIPGDIPDPSVIYINDSYYASGTSSEWGPYFPLFKSTDLVRWNQIGYIFQEKPAWAISSFWAPELFYHHNKIFAYYVAKRKTDSVACIGVAVADHPGATFHDRGILLAYGKEAIDPFVFNDNGSLYLTFKAYGLDRRPIEILGYKLSEDGLKLEGQPFTLLRDDNHTLMEGQCIIKKNNYYYLFYSAGNCCGPQCSYNVRIARANHITGPYQTFDKPILAEEALWKCPGHGTVVEAKNGKLYYLYHAYQKKDDIYTGRQGMLKELLWDKNTGWPHFREPTLPASNARTLNFVDEFNTNELSNRWQWDIKYHQPSVKIEKSRLHLGSYEESENKIGAAITIRPYSGSYNIYTQIIGRQPFLQGLVVYGDDHNAIGLGTLGNKLRVWEIHDGKQQILNEEVLTDSRPRIRICAKNGEIYRFFYQLRNKKWQEIKVNGKNYDGAFLPRWDRSPRPGLIAKGKVGSQAIFANFAMLSR